MSKKLKTMSVGDSIFLEESGELQEFYIMHQGLPSSIYDSSCDGTWVRRRYIDDSFMTTSWMYGMLDNVFERNNDYSSSELHEVLNTTYYNLLSSEVQDSIKTVKIPYSLGTAGGNAVRSGSNGLTTKVFAVSGAELGLSEDTIYDGSLLEYYKTGSKHGAALDTKSKSYWLRSPSYTDDDYISMIFGGQWYNSSGMTNGGLQYSSNYSPMFILDGDLDIDDEGEIYKNSPPTAPSGLTVPSTVKRGESFCISWNAATDPDGDVITYVLEMSPNTGYNWYSLTETTSLSYWTVGGDSDLYRYRVKARDSHGEESDYVVSADISVTTNSAPTKPSSIAYPSFIMGGTTIKVNWSASTDADGNLAGYVLEYSTDGGLTWPQIYQGDSLEAYVLIPSGTSSLYFRVKAYDSEGAESAYMVSAQISVSTNSPPVISGSNGNLGSFVSAPSPTYTVSDVDGGTVTVCESLNDNLYREYTVTLGSSNTVTIPKNTWLRLGNGSHSLKIVATDEFGETATRIYTFTKSETEIELTYLTPYQSSTQPTVGILTVEREIPSGADFSVEVCNNGFDASPSWEVVTACVKNGGRFYFVNDKKAAAQWGFNARVKVARNAASGDCYVSKVYGFFK